ncbi:MEDS domain-containing protein [Clostridium sp. DL1XJH146]
MDTKCLKGKHAALYYYGREHLYVNIAYKIKEAQKSNGKVLLCMDHSDYNELLSILKKEFSYPINNVEFLDIRYMIELSKLNYEQFKVGFKNLASNSKKQGYQTTCVIGLCSAFINVASLNEFLEFEEKITEALENIQLNIICAYDIEDYINDRNTIGEEAIIRSRVDHKYLYTNFRYADMKKELNNIRI